METRVIVCGSRQFKDYDMLEEVLNSILPKYKNIVIVSGHGGGADLAGEEYAIRRGLFLETFPAEWDKYGRAAGPIRNSKMLEYASRELPVVVAFWDGISRGTKYTIEKAKEMGIQTYVYGVER